MTDAKWPWETIEVDLALVDPYPNNPNHADDATRKKIAASLQRPYGQFSDIKVRDHPTKPGRYMLMAGHQRVEVMRSLGWTHASAKYGGQVPEHLALEIMINDNELKGKPDPTATAEVVQELEALNEALGELDSYRDALAYTDDQRETLLEITAELEAIADPIEHLAECLEESTPDDAGAAAPEEPAPRHEKQPSAEVIVRFGFENKDSAMEGMQLLWQLLYDFGETTEKPIKGRYKIPVEFLGDRLLMLLKYMRV